jgi:hypothetical protein
MGPVIAAFAIDDERNGDLGLDDHRRRLAGRRVAHRRPNRLANHRLLDVVHRANSFEPALGASF